MPEGGNEVRTKLSLRVPDEVVVPLVPIGELENFEFRFIWFTVFLSLFSAFLGASISYVTAGNFKSEGIPWLLVIITIIFLVLSLIFGITAFKNRKNLKKDAEKRQEDEFLEMFRGLALDLFSKFGKQFVSISDAHSYLKERGIEHAGSALIDMINRGLIEKTSTGDEEKVRVKIESIIKQ